MSSVSSTAPHGTLGNRAQFSAQRHEVIAGAAERLISAKTKDEVARIVAPLGAGTNLSDIAAWADDVKRRQPRPSDDPDTRAFLEDPRNAASDTWHYVDIPADADAYDRVALPDFTRDDDVVQMLGESIKVLEGTSTRFSELNALRLVVHFVGDVHQPVHVGCSFIESSGATPTLVFDPDVVRSKHLPDDHGGNLILLPMGSKGTALHGYWDSRLGGNVVLDDLVDEHDFAAAAAAFEASEGSTDDAATTAPLLSRAEQRAAIDRLVAMIQSERAGAAADTDPSGPPETWSVAWATASLIAARSAYQGLTVDRVVGKKTKNYFVKWSGRQDYDARNTPVVVERMKSAANFLAKLLDRIYT